MPRPRRDGTQAREARKQRLSDRSVRAIKPETAAFAVWDTYQRGLALRVQPTGQKSWKVVYSCGGRPRWFHVGDASAIGLTDARRVAAKVTLAVAEGKDPVAERMAERGSGTFGALADRYLEEYAKRKNKSWRHTRKKLVEPHLLPRWGKLDAKSITRPDVRALMGQIEAPSIANQVKAAASAIFTWGIKQELITTNPCHKVDGNEVRSRERVLSDSEITLFWSAFDSAGLVRSSALKVLLLTGQRPGEVSCMRREHVADGWWTMPGEEIVAIAWPGTKNKQTHRVWLPEAAREIIAELGDESSNDGKAADFVFAGRGGGAIDDGALADAMRAICAGLRVNEAARPHDLRRTHGTMVTRLGFGRDAMNRIQNHKEGGIADVYDRHEYADENKRVMEAVAARIMALAEGRPEADNVVELRPAS
jgi:integrase